MIRGFLGEAKILTPDFSNGKVTKWYYADLIKHHTPQWLVAENYFLLYESTYDWLYEIQDQRNKRNNR